MYQLLPVSKIQKEKNQDNEKVGFRDLPYPKKYAYFDPQVIFYDPTNLLSTTTNSQKNSYTKCLKFQKNLTGEKGVWAEIRLF